MNVKKGIFLGVLSVLSICYVLVIFAPIFGLTIDGKFVYMGIIEYAQKAELFNVVSVLAGPAVSLIGSLFLWMSFLLKDNQQGDLKDKRYLIGTLVFVLGCVIAGVSGMVAGTFIHMLISVVLAVIYGALIYVHNKYLTTY